MNPNMKTTSKPEQAKAQSTTTNEDSGKPQYPQEELLAIFDDILFSGEYTEDFLIKGKLKVTFKSRTAGEVSAISREIDSKQINLLTTLQEQRALLNLTYSLVAYNGQDWSKLDFEGRKNKVESLPSPVVAALSEALVKFDFKVDAACREGEQNF